MATPDIETLYEEQIKPRSRQEKERLVELVQRERVPAPPQPPEFTPVTDRETMPSLLRDTLDAAAARTGVPFDVLAREWAERYGRPAPVPDLTPEEWEAARQQLRRHGGAAALDQPTGLENDQIDADLAREYAGASLE